LIHPQGLLAVPALMSLAIAFSLAREWRGSLIAPMVMHGVSNGAVMALLMVLAG
jgi:membrane protease YdiL (CAAX protease family)